MASKKDTLLPCFVLFIALLASPSELLAGKVKAYRGHLEIPTYPWWPAVKHPYFPGTDERNIYPYPMLDHLSREKEPRTWQTVVLENEYLRITFLPELGGKIHEVLNKTTGQPMFYVNHVIKPGLIAQCGAWTSGGVEWNTGPQGHTVSAMQPVSVEILPENPDGSRSVALGEVERIYRTKWTVLVTLQPGRSFIEERLRIYNGTETVRPYYFWNCTAAANTPGFRFIYPMTLGCDHSAEKFFRWPFDQGKDLSRGTNYQDASSIFAWHCDQDFFGFYDDAANQGVVAYANHHQVPGKKAWTWGQGGFGRMHQMDLTDADGPYNEVQTGPLLTQGEVGRLEPHEAVTWQEWWYPVHDLGGFTYANKNLAANTAIEDGSLRLRLLGTGTWRKAKVSVVTESGSRTEQTCELAPSQPVEWRTAIKDPQQPLSIEVRTKDGEVLASWRSPLELPLRIPPTQKAPAETASALVQTAWQHYLLARYAEAEKFFNQALEKEPKCRDAKVGLAHLSLEPAPAKAAREAGEAVSMDPDYGPAQFVLAVAECRLGHSQPALEAAWKAALDPATAVAARALVAKLLMREGRFAEVVPVLAEPGPWQSDPVCRNRLALALRQHRKDREADALLTQNLQVDPLDSFAQSIHWLGLSKASRPKQAGFMRELHSLLEVLALYSELGRQETISLILEEVSAQSPAVGRNLLVDYWRRDIGHSRTNTPARAPAKRQQAASPGLTEGESFDSWPYQYEMLPVLQRALASNPADGNAALLLGHLLFHLGQHREARELWKRAADAQASPETALRALGMASLKLDNDSESAARWLSQAHEKDPGDPIVARDLARVFLKLADQTNSPERQREFVIRARETLKPAFENGRRRSDFVTLLARAQNRLGDYAATAQMLDGVRITVWEGSSEAHDLFEAAHVALGKAHLGAGRALEALTELNRALEYPENLATGKLENSCEAHIHYLRGQALNTLGRKSEAITAWNMAIRQPASKDKEKEEARNKAREALKRGHQ